MTIIQVYAPTETADEEEINTFYKTINKAMEKAHDNLIIMGDFNAKIGQPDRNEYLIMKPNGYGERNHRGQRLIDFALENKLSIINTFFKKNPKSKWTWRSPNGQYKNEIDFILSNQPKLFQDIETMNLNYSSDHRPLRTKITLNKPMKSRANYNSNRNVTLKNEVEISVYKETLKTLIPTALDKKETVQVYYDNIINSIIISLKKAQQENNATKTSNILSERTKKLIQRRQELQKTKNKTRSMKNELQALYKLISRYIKNDYKRHRLETFQKYLDQKGSLKKGYKELRTSKTWIEGLKHSGEVTYNRNNIITIATDFYKKLYSETTDNYNNYSSHINDHTRSLQATHNIEPIYLEETIEAIKKLKPDKSPGSDKITNDAIKTAQNILAAPLTHLFNLILETAETPLQWSESNIILLYKKGDPKDVGNYRPISLLPSVYKLFSTIINQRINKTLEQKQPVEQAGFRKNFSTIDHIHTLELIIQKYQEYQRPLYIGFIDYRKAFDTVSHTAIWDTLKAQNVEKEYIDILQNIYRYSKSRIKLETTGPSFPIKRGVRQGDPLSPKLFIAVLESIMNKLDWKRQGLLIRNKYLSHLRFADDIVLFSETSTQLQFMIDTLYKASKEVGLEMNTIKTKVMSNYTKNTIIVDSKPLEYVENYIYLGKKIGFSRNMNEQEIDRRVQNTWNKYWSFKEIFKSDIPVKFKKKIMDSCLIPCLTYACQTWSFTTKIKNKINTCQRGIERSMLNIRKIQKIKHTKIRSRTKSIDALNYAQKLKWKWAGHVARLKDNRWTHTVTLWKGPTGKRNKGRPCTRWEDEIKTIAGPQWQKIAQDRDKWQSLEEAFT